MSHLIVLGPQRRPTVDSVVRGMDLDGPIATVTAGWREREPDDAELDALLGGRSVNLKLYARWQDTWDSDPEYAAAEREHRAALGERQELYLVQLDGVFGAMREVTRYGGSRPGFREAARADSEAALRLVDERHLARMRDAHAEFEAAWRPGEREVVARHRGAVRHVLDGVRALVVPGGHVGALLHVLRLFAVTAPPVVIAWSAGAMALTDRVLLFHDRVPHGSADPEFVGAGLGWLQGCVLLPHARRRLRTDDPARMAELAVRVAPARCVVLDDGVRLDFPPVSAGDHRSAVGALPAGTRVVEPDGRISELAS